MTLHLLYCDYPKDVFSIESTLKKHSKNEGEGRVNSGSDKGIGSRSAGGAIMESGKVATGFDIEQMRKYRRISSYFFLLSTYQIIDYYVLLFIFF